MKTSKFKLLQIVLLNLFAIIILIGCSSNGEKKSESMEQIQKGNGIPVVVRKVVPQKFEKYFSFYGKFKGIKETTIGAMIGGRVDRILVKPGDRVQKDQVIIMFPEDAPASQIQQAKAAYVNSEKNFNRMKALLEKGEIAQAQFDGVETKYLVDKRNYETLKQTLHLDAPYNGVVTQILANEGDNVKKKSPLFTIANISKMKIRIWLSEKERMQIKKGMTALATVEGKIFTGKVSELSLSVDPMKQAFYADIIFDNSKHQIFAGTTADVKIFTFKKDNAIVIPRNLVKMNNSKPYVYIAKDGKAKIQFVTIANESGINYEVNSGLKAGDSLIVKGNARLTDGIKINVVK